jgi:hypothetical protein
MPVRKFDPAARGALDHDALARELLERSAPVETCRSPLAAASTWTR